MSDSIVKENYKAGENIFFEGEVQNHFYIVESGTVQIYTMSKQAERVNIAQIKDGESFGEFALLSNMPRSATAQALTDVVVVKVSEEGFKKLLSELPVWANCMMTSFVDRLQNMTEALKSAEQFSSRD